MFLAGFPDYFRQGCLAQVKDGGEIVKDVVVLDYSPEKSSIWVVNFKSRKKVSVKEHTMEPMNAWHESFDASRLPLFIDIMKNTFLDSKGINFGFVAWNFCVNLFVVLLT